MISKNIELDKGFFGQKTVIVGKSGSGKSYTARVVIEEGLKLKVSFVVIDPQSAYENLEGFIYLNIKQIKDAKALGILLASTAKNVVICTKGKTITEQQKFLKEFLEGYRITYRRGIRTIIIDECHKFAPEQNKALSKEEVRSMSQENRSDGLGFIAVEQRTQRLDKTVITQADNLIIHNMTAGWDLKAIEGCLDNPKVEVPIIRRLKIGEAYFTGFGDPQMQKVREAETTHSGEAPKSLLTEDNTSFDRHIRKYIKGGIKVDNINANDVLTNPVNIPSLNGFGDLVAAGAKMSVGMFAAGMVGAYASKIKSPIPLVSTRTLAGALTTAAVYTGFRKIKNPMIKETMGYAAAGSAVMTAGSALFDVLNALKVRVPNFVNFALNTMTGVQPMAVEGTPGAETAGQGEVDLNTGFA